MKTSTIPPADPKWLIVDAAGQSIGRMSAKIAHVLRGKHRPSYSPHQLCGDHVIVINAAKLDVTPSKGRRKTYVHHTGYLGHIHFKSLTKMMEEKPETVIEKAVFGMLPRNRLRNRMLERLHVFADDKHKYAAQKPEPFDLTTV
jgi:large subunit ribosomal protein L13